LLAIRDGSKTASASESVGSESGANPGPGVMRILVVEDNARVGDVITRALRVDGHQVLLADTCAKGQAELERASFDLAIIDVGLPDGSGVELCRHARAGGHDLPILVLTARTGIDDRVIGLDAGADDYLGKPFANAELTARVRALGRRGPRWAEGKREFGALCIDRERRSATIDGVPLAFTPRELDIVTLLAWREGRVVAKDEILEAVWGSTGDGATASLEVLLVRIRRKLAPLGVEAVRTVRQVGYAWALERSKRS
jgi:two-component system, OmpR family, response regulator